MEISVECVCGAKFTLNSDRRYTPNFTCPNCSQKLPDDMAQHIKNLFVAKEDLANDCRRVIQANEGDCGYEITVPGFTV